MKVSIFGAGRVGVSVAYSLLHSRSVDELVLVDIDVRRAEGEVLDLYHAIPFFKRCEIKAGEARDIAGSDFVVITAGASQSPGETRLDLTERNVKIVRRISEEIVKYAPNAIIINVTNPVDVITYAVWKFTNLSWRRVIGTGTVLDTARFRALVAKQCLVSPSSVHAYVVGEHGDSELLVWSNATIGGVNIKKFCESCFERSCTPLEEIFEMTRRAAYEIIERKGATNLAIGAATAALIWSIHNDEKRVWTVSVLLDDVYIGFPAVVGRDGVERLVPIEFDPKERQDFEKSKEIIRKYIESALRSM